MKETRKIPAIEQNFLRRTLWKLSLALPAVAIAATANFDVTPANIAPNESPVTLGSAAWAQTNWEAVEQDLLAEHNKIRQNPQSYIPVLEDYLARMDAQGNIPNGCGSNCTLITQEGSAAVEEAIDFLRTQPAVDALEYSPGVAQAARAHAQDQKGGATGHTSSDGSEPADRLSRFGVDNLGAGENIAYGPNTAQKVMLNLVVDDGVADRGHRTNIFSPSWTMAGVGCGDHAAIRSVCVIDYIKTAQESAENNQFVINNGGTVELRSLKVADADILGGSLAPGQSRTLTLNDQDCTVTLGIQLGGNYRALDWENLNICDATMSIDEQNSFKLEY